MKHVTITTRQSPFILVTEIVVLETIISLLSYVIKLPLVSGLGDNFAIYSFVTIFVQILNILFIMLIVLRWATTEYRIENSTLVIRNGIFSIKEKIFTLDGIETVEIEQSWIGRLFNFGSVRIYSPLFTHQIYIWAIPEVQKFADEIQSYIPKNSHVTITAKK